MFLNVIAFTALDYVGYTVLIPSVGLDTDGVK